MAGACPFPFAVVVVVPYLAWVDGLAADRDPGSCTAGELALSSPEWDWQVETLFIAE